MSISTNNIATRALAIRSASGLVLNQDLTTIVKDFETIINEIIASEALGITSLTGDGTATGPGASAFTLATIQAAAHTWSLTQTFVKPNIYSGTTSLAALIGGGAAGATAITGEFNNFTTVASAGDSAILSTPALGSRQDVTNSGVAALAVFPVTGGTIDGLSANASVLVFPGQTVSFKGISATAVKSSISNASTQGLGRVTTITKSGAASLTAGELASGTIIYTGNAQNLTLPTATALGPVLGAVQGTEFQFKIDNTGGSDVATVVVNTGIVACSAVLTGQGNLAVTNSATQGIGLFRLAFSSPTAAVLYRMG